MTFWSINIIAALVAFSASALFGFALIPFLKKLNFGQTILDVGPKWHKSKQGTPIMGGFMFIFGSLLACCLGYSLYKKYLLGDLTDALRNNLLRVFTCMVFSVAFGILGFADDYIKAVKKRNLGLRAKHKLLFQILFSAALLKILYELGDKSTEINLMFLKFDLGFFYYPIMLLVIIFVTNAVNLTDGVDGLCGSVTVITMLAIGTLCNIYSLPEVTIYSMCVAGAVMGFLLWNLHPAKVFMGDTGSMFLGGAFVAVSLTLHNHLLLILVGIVYIVEALSVVLQVISFKTTGKRIFKMSPIHHHFELNKWSEYKIVAVFSLISILAAIIAIHTAYRFMPIID
ncbi:phospho-N-acetylmuramoyl-pentapeptide-transferase [Clostridia bacterium]|nr:phospho-N-acetylmuramoyl-pentapeptide-transferase [Clostridia bacterium]